MKINHYSKSQQADLGCYEKIGWQPRLLGWTGLVHVLPPFVHFLQLHKWSKQSTHSLTNTTLITGQVSYFYHTTLCFGLDVSQLLTTSDKEQKSCELTDIDELSKLPSIHSVTPSGGVISIVQCAERHLHAYVPRDNPVHAVASHRQHTEVVCVTVFGDNCIDNQVTSLVCQIVGFFLDVSLCQEISYCQILESWAPGYSSSTENDKVSTV